MGSSGPEGYEKRKSENRFIMRDDDVGFDDELKRARGGSPELQNVLETIHEIKNRQSTISKSTLVDT